MTKFNYPIKRGEPGFEEAIKAIQPGDIVTAVYALQNGLGESATVAGAAWAGKQHCDISAYLGLGTMALRFSNGAPYHYLVELVSVEKPPPPPATVEELEALPEGSTIRDSRGSYWMAYHVPETLQNAFARATVKTGVHASAAYADARFVVNLYGPITIVARAEEATA